MVVVKLKNLLRLTIGSDFSSFGKAKKHIFISVSFVDSMIYHTFSDSNIMQLLLRPWVTKYHIEIFWKLNKYLINVLNFFWSFYAITKKNKIADGNTKIFIFKHEGLNMKALGNKFNAGETNCSFQYYFDICHQNYIMLL